MTRRLDVARSPLRPERLYLWVREAAVLAGVSINFVERQVASGDLRPWLVERQGEGGRPRHLYRFDEVLAVVERKRR